MAASNKWYLNRELWAAVAVAVVLYIVVKRTGALKSEADYADVIPPTQGDEVGLTNGQIKNLARAVHDEFSGWNWSSTGQTRIMQNLAALSNQDLLRVHNAYISLYAGDTLRQLITDEWYVVSWSGSGARTELLSRLDQVGA